MPKNTESDLSSMVSMPIEPLALHLLKTINSGRKSSDTSIASLLLNTLIRHAPGPVYVSKAASKEAKRRGLNDLTAYHWRDQVKKMGDKGRKTFAWDHFYPVAELRRQLDELKSPTVPQVRKILKKASVAWILRSEDEKLNKARFRQHRPDPDAAYQQVGIELINR